MKKSLRIGAGETTLGIIMSPGRRSSWEKVGASSYMTVEMHNGYFYRGIREKLVFY